MMNQHNMGANTQTTMPLVQRTLRDVVVKDFKIWLPMSLMVYVLANILLFGFEQGLKLLPTADYPLLYEGDGIAFLYNIARLLEQPWYFENTRNGFPFGSVLLDFPQSDTGNYLILKILGMVTHSLAQSVNLYILLSYSACFATTYWVSRTLDLNRVIAVVVALLYSFLAYHFARLQHLFFLWYAVIPLYLYMALRLLSDVPPFCGGLKKWKQHVADTALLLICVGFGAYYAIFACFLVAVCMLIALAIMRGRLRVFVGAVMMVVVIVGSVVVHMAPSILYKFSHGENFEGVNRPILDTELYSFKPIQLFLPALGHRLETFAELAMTYYLQFYFNNENASATMGLVASVGWFVLMLTLISIAWNKWPKFLMPPPLFDQSVAKGGVELKASIKEELLQRPRETVSYLSVRQLQLVVLAIIALVFTLFAAMGGFSSLFAIFVTSAARGWNRMSLVIALVSLLAVGIISQLIWLRFSNHLKCQVRADIATVPHISTPKNNLYKLVLCPVALIIVALFGLWDQTAQTCQRCLSRLEEAFSNDKKFVQQIERTLPKGAAIFQMPYVAYAGDAVYDMQAYSHVRGMLHSKDLRFSYGDMRARVGDWFYRKLDRLPFDQQYAVIQAMGFSGIWYDRRGFCDGGSEVENIMKKQIQASLPLNQNVQVIGGVKDSTILLILPKLDEQERLQAKSVANAILKMIDYTLDERFIPQYTGDVTQLIDFKLDEYPSSLNGVLGLSAVTTVWKNDADKKWAQRWSKESCNARPPINVLNSIADRQASGRWSDAHANSTVRLWFIKPLPLKFRLTLDATAAGRNAGKPLTIKIGNQTKQLVVGNEKNNASVGSVEFSLTKPVDKIEFIPYQPFVPAYEWPGAIDKRKVAIEFKTLKIDPL